jgi:endonuclease G
VILEKIINTSDFVFVRYLEEGVVASRAVCRIQIRDQAGRVIGYGTGSLVSPQLLLTNHHVLESADVARSSTAEFNYQDGLDGKPLEPRVFALDPERLFVADQERDFALVAVLASAPELGEFGFNALIQAEGKAIVGEFVTIVQHPRGDKKQVALRENRIVDLPEDFMHYEADTEPGSSGSPVFNNEWEVVALHHASVPAPDRGELGGYMNEGIRVSRILAFIDEQDFSPQQQSLIDELRIERTGASSGGPPGVAPETPRQPPAEAVLQTAAASAASAEGALPLPFEVTLRLGGSGAVDQATIRAPSVARAGEEAIQIDPDYSSRPGYDRDFLGTGPLSVPLPSLSEELLAKAATSSALGEPTYVLPYHHFSVVQNKERRLAFLTAVNIDGRLSYRPDLKREADRWFLDPRIPTEEQTGEAVYANNDLDRGHLVRRLDPGWGSSLAAAKLANDDTFHFTNCTPQHMGFNQNRTTWAGLEDYILYNADNLDFKASVFTGPVFAEDDDEYRGVKLPRQFWKVAAMVKEDRQLSATAYLLSQESLLQGLEVAEDFSYGAYGTYQVPVRQIENLTGLSFGALADADPLAAGPEAAAAAPREIRTPADLVL